MRPRRNLIRRGKVWYSNIVIGDERIRKPLSTDATVAEEMVSEMRDDKNAARHGHKTQNIPWPLFKPKFIKHSKGAKKPGTHRVDMSALRTLESFQKIRRLPDITGELLDQLIVSRKEKGMGNATINREINAIKAMMNKAVEWGYLKTWKAAGVKELPETRCRLIFHTPKDMRLLIAKCQDRIYGFYNWLTVCLLGARAGLRRSEIYWLAWRDVDLVRGIISIVPKPGWDPKTYEQRHIPIPRDLIRHLKRLPKTSEWVMGERPPTLGSMSSHFRKITKSAKLPGGLHTLRHTYASHLVQAGVPLYTVMKLLGHKSIETTMIYSHLAPRNFDDAVAKLPNYVN